MKKSLVKLGLVGLSTLALAGAGIVTTVDSFSTPVAYAHGDHDHDHDHDHEKEELKEDVQLADWEGPWNSLTYYFDMDEVQAEFEHMAEEHGATADEEKAELEEKRKTDFNYIEISEDSIAFYNVEPVAPGEELDEDKKEEVANNKYEFVTAHEMEHGGSKMYWYEFKAVEEDAKYPVVLLMDVHGEEEVPHYHLRFGDDAEELLKEEDWYPIFVQPETTMDQVSEIIGHH